MLCPNSIPSPDYCESWNPGTGNVAAELHDWTSSWWLKPDNEKLFTANQRAAWEGEQKTHPPPVWPCVVTLCADPVSHPTDQPPWVSHQADLQPLLKCMCEGKGNWAVVNLMFLSNQVILCSRSPKGNSCFPAPLLRGHLPLCLSSSWAVESEEGHSSAAFLQMLWGRARKHKKSTLLMVSNR